MALGKATVNILANLKPLKAGLRKARAAVLKATRDIKRDRALTREALGNLFELSGLKRALGVVRFGFTSLFKIVRVGFRNMIRLSKLAAAALLGIGIASIKIASDVVETKNLFKISMGEMADAAERWSRDYSRSLNLFELDTKKAVGTFQLILTSMGLTEKEAFKMSKGLARLTNDISSFRNLNPADVFQKLQGGITGEIRPLRNIGILINETTIKALALKDANIKARLENIKSTRVIDSMGRKIAGATKSAKKQGLVLTEVEKVMLRYKAIVNATGKDTGDMKRTLDDLANVFRQIVAQLKVTANTIGKVFMPEVTKAGVAIREFFVNNQDKIKGWAETTKKSIGAVITKLKEYFDLAKAGKFEEIFKDIGRIFNSLTKGLLELFERVKPFAFNLGKEIADGFMEAIKETKLGKALRSPREVGVRFASPTQLVFEQQKQAGLGGLQSELAQGLQRAKGLPAGTERDELVQEMRKLNRNIQLIVQDNRGFEF